MFEQENSFWTKRFRPKNPFESNIYYSNGWVYVRTQSNFDSNDVNLFDPIQMEGVFEQFIFLFK